MRALRVVGLDEDGESVICEDPDNAERFTVPADERLRAAARGDLTRLGQVQIELESQIRPREIQTRIRSGATVRDVAESSGLPETRVERYAHPVLLERQQIAELSQRAHPVREDGPDVQTLGEVISHTFGMRGLDYNEAEWDAWRGEDNKWVVRLEWAVGKSENAAHWVFHPGAQGGTIAALDDHAADLLDPTPNRPLRTVRPVTELAREALELGQDDTTRTVAEDDDVDATEGPGEEATAEPDKPAERAEPVDTSPDRSTPSIPAVPGLDGAVLRGERDSSTPRGMNPGAAASEGAEHSASPNPAVGSATSNGSGRLGPSTARTAPMSWDRPADAPAEHGARGITEEHGAETYADTAEGESDAAEDEQAGRKQHPIVPSWEDVLLGVRSNR